jgi:hypothetical protein
LIDNNGNKIKLSTPPKQVFPICIVADHYPALAFQARQFLKFETTDEIRPPLITDVFALDAMTEMLETPLRLLSYLDLRSTFGPKILFTHELTLLSAHLKYNLWINENYDFVLFEEILPFISMLRWLYVGKAFRMREHQMVFLRE